MILGHRITATEADSVVCGLLRWRWRTTSHQLQPEVLPQLGQAWQEPARCIWTPQSMQ